MTFKYKQGQPLPSLPTRLYLRITSVGQFQTHWQNHKRKSEWYFLVDSCLSFSLTSCTHRFFSSFRLGTYILFLFSSTCAVHLLLDFPHRCNCTRMIHSRIFLLPLPSSSYFTFLQTHTFSSSLLVSLAPPPPPSPSSLPSYPCLVHHY